MTTPSINTPQVIITDAYREAGVLRETASPSSDQFAKGLRRFWQLTNFAQTQGIPLWLEVDVAITLVAGQATYTLGPGGSVDMTRPLRADQGYILTDSGATRRPIWPISWNEWLMLSNIGSTNPGTISQYFINKQQTYLSVTFWSTPSATEAVNEAHLLLRTQVTNPASLTEEVNFPKEWGLWLTWGLADQLTTGQPESIIARCSTNAEKYFNALLDWSIEDAETMFTPDQRQQYSGSRFR